MKVGINLLLWTAAAGEEHIPVVQQVAKWGYDGVEFPMFGPDCSPWPVLARALDDAGLGRTAVTVMPVDANPISESAEVRRRGLDHLKGCIDACVTLGADVLLGPMYSPCGGLVGRGRSDQEWAWGLEALRPAAGYAHEAGVKLAVEPLNRFETYFLTCLADAVKLTGEVGTAGCGVLFDTFHANIEEKQVGDAVRAAGAAINHVHISENDRSTPGTGHVLWPEVFAALKAIGYDGWLTIEAFGQAMPEVAAATSIWRRMFGTEEELATAGLAFIRRMWQD